MQPRLIGIAGMSGAGKSELARYASLHLPERTQLIWMDSYYFPQDDIPMEERVKVNYDHPDSLDWALFESHLRTIAAGEPIEEPVYRFDQHTRAKETRRIEPARYVIVEGLLALHKPEIRALYEVKVFVTTPDEVCLARRIERDIHQRGRTEESVLAQYHATVLPMAIQFVKPTENYADVVISGEQPLAESYATVSRALSPGQSEEQLPLFRTPTA
jgi:uridine kinase